MNAFAKIQFGPSSLDTPNVPLRFKGSSSRARVANPRVEIVNNIARNQMRRKAGLEFLDLEQIKADRKKRFKGRPQRMGRDELNREAYFAAKSLGTRREKVWIDDLDLNSDEFSMKEPTVAPVVSLAPAPVRRSTFSTRTAIAAAAGALISLMAGGVTAASYATNQTETAAPAQMTSAAPQMSESARVLAEIEDEPEYVNTMNCSVPFTVLEKKMKRWGGWEEALGGITAESKKGSVCDAHKAVQTRWGNKVADKFEYEAKHVPETSHYVEVQKPKKSRWNMAKKMVSKAKGFFGRWA